MLNGGDVADGRPKMSEANQNEGGLSWRGKRGMTSLPAETTVAAETENGGWMMTEDGMTTDEMNENCVEDEVVPRCVHPLVLRCGRV